MNEALDIYEQLQSFVGVESGPPVMAPDPVNAPMIRHWCEAIGDTNPIYLDEAAARAAGHPGIVAPPTMLQAWAMWGLSGRPIGVATDGDPYDRMTQVLFSGGFTSVAATNSDQTYHRYLRVGDRLTMRTVIDAISDEKDTGLGRGHFVSTRQDYYDADDELVATMHFRILRFRPRSGPPTSPPRPSPATTLDNQWWFDGLDDGRLLVQRCAECGATRFPTGPMCARCGSLLWESVDATMTGAIHSFVIVHQPQVPSFDYPLPIVLVDLDDGLRMVMNTVDTAIEALTIGARVTVEVRDAGPAMKLPFARIDTAARS
jgi:3-oxo-4,17-pregnadiene-20-carboxyl-CoA hydratase alpha subunit